MVDLAAVAAEFAALSGLDIQVSRNWINAEGSIHPTNLLGILCGNSLGSGLEIGCDGRFARYRSVSDGLRAAAWLLAHGSHYGEVRQAIASGTPAEQRAAIITSGWAAGGYRNGAGFSTVGISGATGSTGTLASPASSGGPLLDGFLASIGRSLSDPIRDQDVIPFVQYMVSAGLVPRGGRSNPVVLAFENDVRSHIGRPWSSLGSLLQSDATGPNDPFGISAALQGFAGSLGQLAVNLAVVAVILALGYRGVRDLAE